MVNKSALKKLIKIISEGSGSWIGKFFNTNKKPPVETGGDLKFEVQMRGAR